MPRPVRIKKGARRDDIVSTICAETGQKREVIVKEMNDSFWSALFERNPKFREYYFSRYAKGKRNISEILICTGEFSGEGGWAPRAAMFDALVKGGGSVPRMRNYSFVRALKSLEAVGAIEKRQDKPGARTFYRVCWRQEDPLDNPEAELIAKLYTKLDVAEALAHKYGRLLGMSEGDVEAELERDFKEKWGDRMYARREPS